MTHKEIQTNLDSELIIKALQLQALSSQDKPDPSNLNHIQQQLTAININKVNQHFKDSTTLKNRKIPYMSSTVDFQLWDKNNNIVLRSQDAPELSLLGPITGFSDIKYNDKTWRTYTLRSSDNHYNVVTAEHSDYRQHLENQLTQDSIFIMIITYPFWGS